MGDYKPTLERCILRYFLQGDYDLIEADEYCAIAMYMRDHDSVEITDDGGDPSQILDLLRAHASRRLTSIEELESGFMEAGREAMARFITHAYNCGLFDTLVKPLPCDAEQCPHGGLIDKLERQEGSQ